MPPAPHASQLELGGRGSEHARKPSADRSISPSDRDRQGARRRAKMSWQTYVDEHLMCEIEGHHLTSAAILGHDGAVWAQSAAFPQVIAILLDFCMVALRFLFF